jgi:hypothetical protein
MKAEPVWHGGSDSALERRARQERAKPRESRMEDGKPHFINHFVDINEMVG